MQDAKIKAPLCGAFIFGFRSIGILLFTGGNAAPAPPYCAVPGVRIACILIYRDIERASELYIVWGSVFVQTKRHPLSSLTECVFSFCSFYYLQKPVGSRSPWQRVRCIACFGFFMKIRAQLPRPYENKSTAMQCLYSSIKAAPQSAFLQRNSIERIFAQTLSFSDTQSV